MHSKSEMSLSAVRWVQKCDRKNIDNTNMELNDIMTVAHEPEKTNGKAEDGTEKHSIIMSLNVWDTRKTKAKKSRIKKRRNFSAFVKRETAAVAAASSSKQQVVEHRIV